MRRGRDAGDAALPTHRLEVPQPQALPFAVGTFDTIGPLSRAAFPHRHTFYEILHVTSGRGVHVVDLARQELRAPRGRRPGAGPPLGGRGRA